MKFLHTLGARNVGIPPAIKDTLQEQPARSGMYNWIFVFKGEIKPFEYVKDNLEDYDVVQLNMSPKDMPIISEIRRLLKNSSTQLVLNNDYVCEYWGKWGINPFMYDQCQRHADMLFGTEPHQVSNMLDGTFCIPHPTNIDTVKHIGSNYPKENSVGFIYHWWAGHTYLPGRTMDIIKKEYKLTTTRLYGYMPEWDEMSKWVGSRFDVIEPMDSFSKFAEKIQRERCIYDPNPFHTYGRNGVECACWGVPIVGSDRVFSYKKLFPEWTCDPFDMKKTREIFKKVLTGDNSEIMKRAKKEVEYFNYKNSRKRFMEALEICKERGGTEWYQKNG